MRILLATLLFSIAHQAAWAEPAITLVRVLKNEHKLQLIAGDNLIREFHVVFGENPQGHKMQEGDGRTPEGLYTLDYKKRDSSFHRAIHISYPNAKDIAAANVRNVRPGGQIMIHGQKNGLGWLSSISQRFNWTNGCVALSDADMDVVWMLVKEGTPIEVVP
jgi:murein L,D-transpeptidase YafK